MSTVDTARYRMDTKREKFIREILDPRSVSMDFTTILDAARDLLADRDALADDLERREKNYPTSLDATMRAARKLPPQKYRFELAIQDHNSWATIIDDVGRTVAYHWDNQSDPARAAFECLFSFLSAQQVKE